MPKLHVSRRTLCPLNLFRFLAVATLALVVPMHAADFHITPSGAGTATGLDFANALPKSALSTTLNTSMTAGDTLYLGSGSYGNSTLSLSSSGTSSHWKRIIGVDTGSGIPHFDGDGTWDRSAPASGQHSIITLNGNYWSIENLELSGVIYAIKGSTAVSNLHFKDLVMHDVRHGVYVEFLDDALFDNIKLTEYTKHGFRMNQGCDRISFRNCLADLSGGDESWWDYSELFPFGFVLENKGIPNTSITFVDCIARNHRINAQGISYWNGDGFTAENGAIDTRYIRCIAVNNEDGGFDIKATATFEGCVSIRNYQGFRLWDTDNTLSNCVVAYPFRRSNAAPAGADLGAGIWLQDGTVTIDHYTFHSNVGTAINETRDGSAVVTNSVLSFTDASGAFTAGNITLAAGTVTYRPGAGTDPDLFDPSPLWDGIGDAFNSNEYGGIHGYHAGLTPYEAEELVVIGASDEVTLVTDLAASGGKWVQLGSNAANDFIEFILPNVGAGSYTLYVSDQTDSDRGMYQLTVEGNAVGGAVDQYTSSASFGEVAVGSFDLASNASPLVRFTVTGHRASSADFKLSIDSIRLVQNGSVAATVFNISPEADTYVYQALPVRNYGSYTELLVMDNGIGYERVSYLRFPVSAVTGAMIRATLELKLDWAGGDGTGTRNVEVRQLTNDSWDESTMTWNTRASSAGTSITTFDAPTVGGTYRVDVSAYVEQEINGDGVVSFALVQPGAPDKMLGFGSRESAASKPALEVESQPFEVLVFDLADFSDYSSQSTTGAMVLESGNTAIHLTGNYWRKYAYAYEVTPSTVIELTLDASNVGELTAVGFDSDDDFWSVRSHIKLAGSQDLEARFDPIDPLYVAGSGPVTFTLPIGSVFTGSMSHLTFVGDDDASANVDITFSNIRVYESE